MVQITGSKKLSNVSIAISCTFFTVFVISGAIFATYLLNKLDLLEAEVCMCNPIKYFMIMKLTIFYVTDKSHCYDLLFECKSHKLYASWFQNNYGKA